MGTPIGVDTDYVLTVTVRIYGGGEVDEAVQALKSHQGTFLLSGDREVEVIDVKPAPIA